MKKAILWIVCVCVVVFLATRSFKSSAPKGVETRPVIMASGYVPFILATEISGDKTNVEMLLPPNAEPHSFEPTPRDLIAVHQARVFVYVSDKLEPWVKDVLGAAGQETRVISLANSLPQTEDPHVWMDFDNVRRMARMMADTLAGLDPQHAGIYQENLARFEQKIIQLDKAFAEGLSVCESREVVHIGHLAFGALAKRYHLALTSLAGTAHEGENSAHKLADLVKHIARAHVKTVFTEEAVSARLAQTVANETDTQILPLYTIEHVSKDDFLSGVLYEELMERNLKNLQQGLVCKK